MRQERGTFSDIRGQWSFTPIEGEGAGTLVELVLTIDVPKALDVFGASKIASLLAGDFMDSFVLEASSRYSSSASG